MLYNFITKKKKKKKKKKKRKNIETPFQIQPYFTISVAASISFMRPTLLSVCSNPSFTSFRILEIIIVCFSHTKFKLSWIKQEYDERNKKFHKKQLTKLNVIAAALMDLKTLVFTFYEETKNFIKTTARYNIKMFSINCL